MALISVCLGVLTSFGICSLIGLAYGPMHSLIPCLLIGLGVDNAFVLVQALNNVNDKEEGKILRFLMFLNASSMRPQCVIELE